MTFIDNEWDLSDQADGNESNQCNGNREGNYTFSESELLFLQVFRTISVLMLICLKNGIVDAFMRTNLEEDIDGVGDEEEDGCDAGDVEDTLADFNSSCSTLVGDRSMEYGRNDQTKATVFC
jgi:hypothetical protein